ncbi:MAG: hypothetical protein GC134_01070 [Proteobacteria bacterium]|nr:hypothetical protein [Pseudomonadota bacterium]
MHDRSSTAFQEDYREGDELRSSPRTQVPFTPERAIANINRSVDAYLIHKGQELAELEAQRRIADYEQKADLISMEQLEHPSTARVMELGARIRSLRADRQKGALQLALENDLVDRGFEGLSLPDGKNRGAAFLDMVNAYRNMNDDARRETIMCQYQIYEYAASQGVEVEELATPHNDRTVEPELYDLGVCAISHEDERGHHLKIHAQSCTFACGAASALTALESVRPDLVQHNNPLQQYDLYRRANAGFMGEGMPGCSPFGLARGVREMGVDVEVWANKRSYFDGWTPGERGQIADRLQSYDEGICREMGIPIREGGYDISDIADALKSGAKVQVLRGYTDEGLEDMRHWITVLEVDTEKGLVKVGDPWVEGVTLDEKYGSAIQDIPFDEFRQIIRHNGDERAQAALIYRPKHKEPVEPVLHDLSAPDRMPDEVMYRASQSFTSGAAALLTAASALDKNFKPSQNLELDLWRRSNMIYSGTELAHCDMVALARSAKTMGLEVDLVHQNLDRHVFGERNMPEQDKQDLQILLRKMDSLEAELDGIQAQELVHRASLGADYLQAYASKERQAIVLLGKDADGHEQPYGSYAVVKHIDDNSVTYYDVRQDGGGERTVDKETFNSMMRYGREGENVATAVMFVSSRAY